MQLECARQVRRRGLSMTPLIDVVFILLLFFLLASHFDRPAALQVSAAPLDETLAVPEDKPTLLLRLSANGELDLNGEPLASDQLRLRLAEYQTQWPEVSVVIEAADQLDLQSIVRAIDLVVDSGVEQVNLQ